MLCSHAPICCACDAFCPVFDACFIVAPPARRSDSRDNRQHRSTPKRRVVVHMGSPWGAFLLGSDSARAPIVFTSCIYLEFDHRTQIRHRPVSAQAYVMFTEAGSVAANPFLCGRSQGPNTGNTVFGMCSPAYLNAGLMEALPR